MSKSRKDMLDSCEIFKIGIMRESYKVELNHVVFDFISMCR